MATRTRTQIDTYLTGTKLSDSRTLSALYPDNTQGQITAENLRTGLKDITDSVLFSSEIEANPTDTGTTSLSKLSINGTVYNIAASSGGEANVQSDWTETDNMSDAFILNKPTIPSTTNDLTEMNNLFFTSERVDDRVNALLIGGTNITLTYNDTAGTLTIDSTASGGTTITGGASTIATADLTASRALISNSSGKVAVSTVTDTELGYLDGVTSSIQTQLDAKTSFDGAYSSLTGAPTIPTVRGAGDGLELSGNNLQIDLDGSTLAVGTGGIKLSDSLARDRGTYSTISSYVVGDIVSNSGTIYRCKTAITTGETFTASKWDDLSTVGSGGTTITGAASTIATSDLTVSRALISNSSGKVAVSAVTDTELGYLDGVRSDIQPQIDAQNSILSIWDGLADPLTAGFSSSATGKYYGDDHVWAIIGNPTNSGSGANDRTNPLWADNDAVNWTRAFAFRCQMTYTKPAGSDASNGSVQIFWGGNEVSSPSWLGSYDRGLGVWMSRVRTSSTVDVQYDNWLYASLVSMDTSAGGTPSKLTAGFVSNAATHTTLYNGALRTKITTPNRRQISTSSIFNTNASGFWIPVTDDELDVQVRGVGRWIYIYVNGTRYARIDISDITGIRYGARFGWLGDGGGTNGNQALLKNAFVGTPDPNNIIQISSDAVSIGDTDDILEGATNLYFTDERVDDRVNALLTAGTNITLDYDDSANSLTINSTASGGSPTLTQAQQIGLLRFDFTPAVLSYSSGTTLAAALEKTFGIEVSNRGLLTGDIWVQGTIGGRPSLSRTSWSSAPNVLGFPVDTPTATAIAGSLGNGSTLEFILTFYDASTGGNLVGSSRLKLPVVHPLPPDVQTLTSAATIAWNVDSGEIADLTAAHDFTLNLTNGSDGQTALLRVAQDATGSRTMTFNNAIGLDGRTAPTLSTAANANDMVMFHRRGTTWVYVGIVQNG